MKRATVACAALLACAACDGTRDPNSAAKAGEPVRISASPLARAFLHDPRHAVGEYGGHPLLIDGTASTGPGLPLTLRTAAQPERLVIVLAAPGPVVDGAPLTVLCTGVERTGAAVRATGCLITGAEG